MIEVILFIICPMVIVVSALILYKKQIRDAIEDDEENDIDENEE
jgi:hypothetical protein